MTNSILEITESEYLIKLNKSNFDLSFIRIYGMPALHRTQDAVAPRLDRQVHPIAKIFILIDRIDDIGIKIAWKRSVKFYSLDSGCGDSPEEFCKRRRAAKTF